MVAMKRKSSLDGRALVCGLLVVLAGLGTGSARAEGGDQPASPPSLFEIMKSPTPSAEQAMNNAVREGVLAQPAASNECAHHTDGGMRKKRPSISTALKSVCASSKSDHEGTPAVDNRPTTDKP
jgi:hypothetical protein